MLTYLLQTIACSGVLYGYYHFFLRNERFHQYNRFYLLFSVALSLLLPLIKIPVQVNSMNNANPVYALVNIGESVSVQARQGSDYHFLLYGVYILMAALLFGKLIAAVCNIFRIRKQATGRKINDISFFETDHPDSPFSFFKWLFWNKNIQTDSPEGDHIFLHEVYHIRNKHSWDLLFIEITICVFWFNPFFYFYRKEIKTIQEFLADQHATDGGDKVSYAELLLLRAIGIPNQKLINPFFHNQLKRRIAMLTTSKKPAYQWLRKLLVLPIVALSVALFAFTYKKEIKNILTDAPASFHLPVTNENKKPAVNNIPEAALTKKDTVPAKEKGEAARQTFNEVTARYISGSGRYRKLQPVTVVGWTDTEPQKMKLKEGEMKIDVDASYPGNWNNFLERNIDGQLPTDKGAPAGNYEVLVRFTVNEDGSLSGFEPVTNEGYGMEDEVIRVLKHSKNWQPAINNEGGGSNKNVKSYRLQPVNFQVVSKKVNSGTADVNRNQQNSSDVFTKVEVSADYPGNWVNFLQRNLDASVATKNSAPPGNHTTIVQFIVDVTGNVYDIKALTKIGYGMEEEAMRVIRKSGKWKPAIQNGRAVTSYRKQPITFTITEE